MDAGLLTLLSAFAFALGACVASFLNVVIWRVPRGESIVSPPSHCPKCGAAIRWFQNVPVVSWLALRGRCASCRAPISPRYVVVEALGGVLFLAVFLRYGTLWRFGAEGLFVIAVMWTWTALMIAGSFIDFDHKLLPDFTTVGGMALGLFCAMAHVFAFGRPWGYVTWSAIGLVFGFGLLWLVRFFGSKAFGREAMGLGDVFLMGAVGAMCGPVAVLATLILSSTIGAVVGLVSAAASKSRRGRFVEIPFGPYICLGCLVWMFGGPELVRAYLGLMFG